jgi:hypothetical protein
MADDLDAPVQPKTASHWRMILGATLALCGMAVGSDAQGAVALSVGTSVHQGIELTASPTHLCVKR